MFGHEHKPKKVSVNHDNASVKRVGVRLHLELPVYAPEGHPHVIDITSLAKCLPDNLSAVDAIASVLYKWNARALSDLLDFQKKEFYWSFNDGLGHEYYVTRCGREVCVGSIEPDTDFAPDFEVRYDITEVGCWKFAGGADIDGRDLYFSAYDAHGHQLCIEYDNQFAKTMIKKKCWKETDKCETFRYEVDGEDLIDPKN